MSAWAAAFSESGHRAPGGGAGLRAQKAMGNGGCLRWCQGHAPWRVGQKVVDARGESPHAPEAGPATPQLVTSETAWANSAGASGAISTRGQDG